MCTIFESCKEVHVKNTGMISIASLTPVHAVLNTLVVVFIYRSNKPVWLTK